MTAENNVLFCFSRAHVRKSKGLLRSVRTTDMPASRLATLTAADISNGST